MEIKTSELSGAALDWAVLVAIGGEADMDLCHSGKIWGVWDDLALSQHFSPSSNWSQGGPLMDLYDIDVNSAINEGVVATIYFPTALHLTGETRLIAVCRAIVAEYLGDTVTAPNELEGE